MGSEFGDLLRRCRVAAGLTQEALAERAGLSVRGISDLERGARGLPRRDTLVLLLQALDPPPPQRDLMVAAARRAPTAISGRNWEAGSLTLPVSPTPLIGREQELAAARDRFRAEDVRLVTLTGPGGVGKTRLGLQLAADLIDQVADGVVFVALASVTDPDHVTSTIAKALGVRDVPGRSLLAGLQDALRDKERLLLLDSFEHLLAAATVVAELLAVCSRLKVLVTSREPLRLRGEREFAVPPLALPDTRRQMEPSALAQVAAVQLFLARGLEVRADFALSTENATTIAEICHRLDGLPLALELAAARIKTLSPASLLVRLDRSLPLLTRGPHDLPQRQQTMRDAIGWSYDLLAAEDQALYRQLAVFAGGWTPEAAEWVTGGTTPGHPAGVLDGIGSLVDKSLVRQLDTADGEPRFGMLETIRAYGLERLEESGEVEDLRCRHAEFVLELSERAETLLVGPDQGVWLRRLEVELPELRAALRWALALGADQAEISIRLATAGWHFWYMSGRSREGIDRLERALAIKGGSSTTRARAETALGTLYATVADYVRADLLLRAAETTLRAAGDWSGTALTTLHRAIVVQEQGDHQQAVPFLEDALASFDAAGLPEDRPWAGFAMTLLGLAAAGQGDLERGRALGEQALAWQRAADSRPGTVYALIFLAATLQASGDHAGALACFREALGLDWEQGDKRGLLECFTGIAASAAARGEAALAARLVGALEALREAMAVPVSPRLRPIQEGAAAAARTALGEEGFAVERESGHALPPEEAVKMALADGDMAGRNDLV